MSLPLALDPDLDLVRPPQVLYLGLSASDICNYRCRHCHIWMQERRPDPLSAARRRELLEEFAAWNPGGTVTLPGGEVMLDLEEVIETAAQCRTLGLQLIVLSNGSTVATPEVADRIVDSGIRFLGVSLDGPSAELHDYTRGVAGAFDETIRAIRLLVSARSRLETAFHLIVTCVLFKESLPRFADLVELCRELGVPSVDFQLLGRTFANRHRTRDVFFEKHFWHEPGEKAAAREQVLAILERYAADPLVVKKPVDAEWILPYIEDPDYRTAEPICGSHYHSLFVDAEGNSALCFNSAAILDNPYVGNARSMSLRELWGGVQAARHRSVMDGCTLNCGALNCHRRPSVEKGRA